MSASNNIPQTTPAAGATTPPPQKPREIGCFLVWVLMVVASFFSALRPSALIAAIAMLAVGLLRKRSHWLAKGIAGFLWPMAVGTVGFVVFAFILDNFVRPNADVPDTVETLVVYAGMLLQPLADMKLSDWFKLLAVLLIIGIGLKKWQFASGTIAFLKLLGSVYAALIAFASFSFFAAPPTKDWAGVIAREVMRYEHEIRLDFAEWEQRDKKAALLGKALERQRDELKEFKSDIDWIAGLDARQRIPATEQWLIYIFGPSGPRGPGPLSKVRGPFFNPRVFEPRVFERFTGRPFTYVPWRQILTGESMPTATEYRSARATVEKVTVVKQQATAKVQLLSTTLTNAVVELAPGNMVSKQFLAAVGEEALTKVRLQELIADGEARVKSVIRSAQQRADAVRADFRAFVAEGLLPREDGWPHKETAQDRIIQEKVNNGHPLTPAEKRRARARCPICGIPNCPLAR